MMRIVFMGTPDFAVPTLERLLAAGHEVAAVYTQPPRAAGPRPQCTEIAGSGLRRDEGHPGAHAASVSRARPSSQRSATSNPMPPSSSPMACCCRGRFSKRPALAASMCMPRCCRAGAAPRRSSAPSWPATPRPASRSCIWARGWTPGRFASPSASRFRPEETAGELHDRLADVGARLMVEALADLEHGRLACREQGTARPMPPRSRPLTRVSTGRARRRVHNQIRGLSPHPGAWFEAELNGKPERVKVLRAPPSPRATARPAPCSTNGSPSLAARARPSDRGPARRQARHEGGEFPARRGASPWREARVKGSAPCPATSSPSNMTARPSSAGSCRTGNLSVQGASPRPSAFSGEDAIPRGAGRTDTGVHALGQVAHVDLAKDWPPNTVRNASNALLRPDPISVLACERGAADFDARFSAKARHYLYRIIDRRSPLGARARARLGRVPRPRRRGHGPSGPGAGRAPRLHHLPLHRMPGGIAGEDPRPARRVAPWRGHQGRGQRRAPSCTIRCAPWSARSSSSATANGARTTSKPRLPPATGGAAARSPRRTASISSRSTISRVLAPRARREALAKALIFLYLSAARRGADRPKAPMIKRIATVGGLTLVSRVTGFIRDVVMAAVLGAGPDGRRLLRRLPPAQPFSRHPRRRRLQCGLRPRLCSHP